MKLIAALLICLPALVFCQLDINQIEQDIFNALDANKNGILLRGEIDIFFQQHDADHTGTISLNEYTEAIHANFGQDPALAGAYNNLFKVLDVDNDSIVDHHDLDQIFLRADGNKDSQVTAAEFKTYFNSIIWQVILG
ncbi:uncharacterized protein LOC131947696 [Physella acuta]|uniref:uncharacterized protein LOC131947696 n=1 Tax=Physella acuta TaxID=109671 RepID=UPI0027DBB84B|nr:uncharacterized protein LOC131947696 [Physella acuta]